MPADNLKSLIDSAITSIDNARHGTARQRRVVYRLLERAKSTWEDQLASNHSEWKVDWENPRLFFRNAGPHGIKGRLMFGSLDQDYLKVARISERAPGIRPFSFAIDTARRLFEVEEPHVVGIVVPDIDADRQYILTIAGETWFAKRPASFDEGAGMALLLFAFDADQRSVEEPLILATWRYPSPPPPRRSGNEEPRRPEDRDKPTPADQEEKAS